MMPPTSCTDGAAWALGAIAARLSGDQGRGPTANSLFGGERLLPLPRGGPLDRGVKGKGPGTGRTRQWAGLRVGFHPCLLPP